MKDGKKEYIKAVFASIATVYDAMNCIMSFGLVKKWRRQAVKHCRIKPGDRVLDVCTGTGELAFLLAKEAGAQGSVVGVDISQEMLEIARQKLELLQQKKQVVYQVSFIEGDALQLLFPSGIFDCVTMAFALRNVSDIFLAVLEMVRVCKKNGRVICLEISEPERESSLMHKGFKLYFYHVIPFLGKCIGKGGVIFHKLPAYSWLAHSLKKFPQRDEMARIFQEAGLCAVKWYPLSGGVVTLYYGEKK